MGRSRIVVDLANVAVLLGGGLLASSYIISPDLRRWVEVHITNRSAWYYLGKYVQREEGTLHAPGGWEGPAEGCESIERTFYHVGWAESAPFEESVFEDLPGRILISINETPTAGRSGHSEDDRFSDNPIVALAPAGRCYVVRQVARRPIGRLPGCDGELRESVAYWAEMAYVTCD